MEEKCPVCVRPFEKRKLSPEEAIAELKSFIVDGCDCANCTSNRNEIAELEKVNYDRKEMFNMRKG